MSLSNYSMRKFSINTLNLSSASQSTAILANVINVRIGYNTNSSDALNSSAID